MFIVIVLALCGALLTFFLLAWSGDQRISMPGAESSGTGAVSIESLIRAGRKIEAIKMYRMEHGVGLKEAKEAVEALQSGLPPR